MKTKEASVNSITEGTIWKPLLYFFFPILFGTFFQQLYNTVDAVIVGNFVGKEALASVGGSTGTIINLLVGFFTGLSSGSTVIVSQFWGAKNDRDTSEAVHSSIALAIAGGIILTIIGLLFAPWALRAMSTPEEIMSYSSTYLRIYFMGMIPSLIYNMGSGILRAIGDSKRPLYYLIVACFVNIVLDILFVVCFRWEIFGVALATVISQVISAILIMHRLMKTTLSYKVIIKKIKFSPHILSNIIRIGLPAGIQSIMYSASNLIIQASINKLGTDTVAAWTAYGKIDLFFWMTLGAFGVSITTFAGQNYGAGKYDRIKKGTRVCLLMTAAATIFITAVLLLTSRYLFYLFTQDETVIQIGLQMVYFLVPAYITFVIVEIISGTLRACGSALIPMIMTCLGVCVLRVVWIIAVVPLKPTLHTIMFSYPLTWCITSVMFLLYYKKGKWLKK